MHCFHRGGGGGMWICGLGVWEGGSGGRLGAGLVAAGFATGAGCARFQQRFWGPWKNGCEICQVPRMGERGLSCSFWTK